MSTEMGHAERLFLEFLESARHPELELDEFYRKHETLAPELRGLWEKLSTTSRLLDAYGDGDTIEFGLDGARYQLVGEIARGGMGRILEVQDLRLGRTLAMKVLRGDGVQDEGGSPSRARKRRRLLNEARILGLLEHPSIVPIHELGEDDRGRPYFTMLRVRGRRLDEVFRDVRDGRSAWSLTKSVSVLQRVTEAISHAHDRGILHRDLKPQNVMIGLFGEVFVMDWGLAKFRFSDSPRGLRSWARANEGHADPTSPDGREVDEGQRVLSDEEFDAVASAPVLTLEGDVVGTPAYMAPEQAAGRLSEIDEQSDVYSIGAMIYHLLAGRPPYVDPESGSTPLEVLHAAQSRAPEPIEVVAPDAPVELAAICRRAMERSRARRYASAPELARELEAYLEGRPVRAHKTGPVVELRKWAARNRRLAGTLLLAAGLLFAWLGSSVWMMSSQAAELRQMSDHKRVADLMQDAERLWPVGPELAAPLSEWIRAARELEARLPLHAETLRRLEGRGSRDPEADDDWRARMRARDSAILRQRELVRAREAAFGVASDEGESPTERESARQGWIQALRDLERIEAEPVVRPTPVLSTEDAWQYESTSELILQIERVNDSNGQLGRMQRRLEIARTIEYESIDSPEAQARWREAVESIADVESSPPYDGLRIEPILGLLPIGQNPETELWEFTHLASGEAVVRDGTGKLVMTDESGIVLVLLPGGNATLGSQDLDPSLPHYCAGADANFERLRACELEPFFFAAFETTQGQWRQMTGTNRSEFTFSDSHPVECVSWNDCETWLGRYGLRLPTRDEWEYAARGGSTTRWASGMEVESTRLHANLRDQTALRNGGVPEGTPAEAWSDGFGQTAPVGSFLPNDFGLYDTLGNLQEWLAQARMRAGACFAQVAEAGRPSRSQPSSVDSRDQVGTVRVAASLPSRPMRAGFESGVVGPIADVGRPIAAWSCEHAGSAALRSSAAIREGFLGDAFDLDGNGAWVDLGGAVGDFGEGDFTIELWVRPRSDRHQVVIEKYAEAGGEPRSFGWTLVYDGGRFQFHCRSGKHGVSVESWFALPDRWHHVAFVRDANWHRLYVDGSSSAEIQSPLYDVSSSSTCRIGRRARSQNTPGSSDDRGFAFDGLVDEIAIYDRALAAEQVHAIYTAGSSGKTGE